MKRALAILLLLAAGSVQAGDIQDLRRLVDFDLTLKSLYLLANGGKLGEVDRTKFFIVEGAVASRQVLVSSETEYKAQLELVVGEWSGVEDVLVYRCYIHLIGLSFVNYVPARRTRSVHPDEIPLSAQIMVVGRLIGQQEDKDGNIVPVVEAVIVRKL